MALHWAYDYLGKPWVLGATGPDAYDCWGLVRAVLTDRFGIDAPAVVMPDVEGLAVVREAMAQFQHHPELARWREVEAPQEGDAVLLSAALDPWHVGLWLSVDGGGVLHCVDGAGVIFTAPLALQAAGWRRLSYWRFMGEAV